MATRDYGLTAIRLWGSQRYVLREIAQGLRDGYHTFVILKGRQVGVSSLMLLLTLFWMQRWKGLQGACVADSAENREYFRSLLLQASEACAHELNRGDLCLCPEGEEGRRPTRNVVQLVWRNQSRLLYQVAGSRTSERLGVGRGIAFLHATEVARWPRRDAVTFLRASFSSIHPAALYVFESTARGRNWFFDAWARGDRSTERHVFVGWWRRDDFAIPQTDRRWNDYWTGRRTSREQLWAREVRRRWDVELTDEQLVWRRWWVDEQAGGDESLADQEMPTLPEEAFEATARPFVAPDVLRAMERRARAAGAPRRFRWITGDRYETCRVEPARAGAALEVWEAPRGDACYVVAAVPPFASPPAPPQPEDTEGVVSVWRATEDELFQVAEYAESDTGMQPFAWTITHLAGTWCGVRQAFVLELTGLGDGVLQELRRLRDWGWGSRTTEAQRALMRLGEYIWRRPDSMWASGAWHWKSTAQIRTWLLMRLRDQLLAERVHPRSDALRDQLSRLKQEGSRIDAEGADPRDHRVLAAALAVEAWHRQLVPLFRRVIHEARDTTPAGVVREAIERLQRRGPARVVV